MSNEAVGTLAIFGFILLFCGLIAVKIADKRSLSAPFIYFLLGVLLGPLGILAAAIAPSGPPRAPEGTKAVVCPRCNAQQNVPAADASYECWQCKLAVPVH